MPILCLFDIGRSPGHAPALAHMGVAVGLAMLLGTDSSRADIDPVSGIDLVRITHPGNAPWMGDGRPTDLAVGRGRVDYEYAIGRFEVTTSQWVEFFNAAFDRPADDRIPFLSPPTFWGASGAPPITPGGQRWRVPAGNEMRPVGGISWRMAAIYCNFLHNGKATTRDAFLTGAYDVSTFGFDPGTRFTDQREHTPGARYWISTWDEALKASHFDPNRFGDNQPGWWVWNDASTTFATWGPPDVGEANYGWRFQNGVSAYEIPLGAYPQTMSPWGLFDVAGATSEWTEEVMGGVGLLYRGVEGSYWGSDTGQGVADSIYAIGGELPHINSLEFGLRIASSVPSPVCAGVMFGCLSMARRRRKSMSVLVAPTLALMAIPLATHADIDPLSGIDLIRIGAAGNAPYQTANPNDFVNGRGGVGYEYSIGRMEVTTSQWVEFFNAAFDRPADDRIPFVSAPNFWGGAPTAPTTPGGQRWSVPAGNELRPVGNISWRTAAIYVNWLNNGKATTREAFMSGAYDVSTFGFQGAIFTDQLAHSPGARYWIPTWDEWLKAAHYDPDKNGPGQGGWWQYSNGSDDPYLYGPPGTGQANAGFSNPSPFSIPLGSYPDVQSPWGLLDMAGGTTEWTESIASINTGQRYRIHDGSHWGEDGFQAQLADRLRERGSEFPHIPTLEYGLRIASVVPAANMCAPAGVLLVILGARRKRPVACTNG